MDGMKKMVLAVFILFLYGADYSKIPLLKWAGPEGTKPGTYEEWIAQNPCAEFSFILDKIIAGDGRAGTVAILTQQSIANALINEINQLINNLQLEGYTVLSYQISGGTPEALRTFLQNLYNVNNIEGALFIGNLPVAWFEIADDFNQYGYAEFPIDLFYMDLNGTWLDTMNTGNGKYDGHTGNVNPEIYIGRLTPTGIGDDTLLLKNYLRKDNAYRHDTINLQHRALVFCDDDWIFWAPLWAYEVSLLYSDTMNYWNAETTRASVYRIKLDTVQAWVSVFAHSWPGGHQFKYNNGNSYDYYYSYEYTNQNPPTNFYNHFACSFARYTENGYGGGRSIFNQSYGLGEVGSTKTGSMLDFSYFYQPLSQQKTLGEAFKDWFTHITNNGVTFDELCWHYGMTLLGDPWLKPTGHYPRIAEKIQGEIEPVPVELSNNPSSEKLGILLNINHPSFVRVIAYDCLGRDVKDIVSGNYVSSVLKITWNFKDNNNQSLRAGTYFIKFEIEGKTFIKKVVKI
uniref:T9SS type A sorting domain-containing protein n=1 Tax=candidate division WOR-3 bacterium TaxID=2052148 RepID=A0A7C4XJI7_UNCW3